MAHFVPRLSCLFDGVFEIVEALLLHGKELVFLLKPRVAVEAVRHQPEDRVEPEKQRQKRDAEHHVALQHAPSLKRRLIARDHEQIQQDEHQRQNPEHIPRPRKIVVLDHCAHRVGRRIICRGHGQPADRVIENAGAKAEPRLVQRQLHPQYHGGADSSGQAVNTAQTDSAIVPDFQREIRSILIYRKTARGVRNAEASAVDTRSRQQSSPPPTQRASSSGSSHAASLPGVCFR